MATIDKKELEHLADLARLELNSAEEDKFLADFTKIFDHFKELSELKPKPTTGLKPRRTVLREDAADLPNHFANQKGITKAFPDQKNGYLKVPHIFEK